MSEHLLHLDAFGLAAAGWIGTWLLHSILLCLLALCAGPFLPAGVLRERAYKIALLGAFVTTGAGLSLDLGGVLRFELARPAPLEAAIGVGGALPAPDGGGDPALGRPQSPPPSSTAPAGHLGPRWRAAHGLPLAALLAALFGAASLLNERRRLAALLAGRRPVERADWMEDMRRLSDLAGLRRVPRLCASAALGSPIALLRGELVVPTRALDGLDRDTRRALLAHEIAHLKRRDPLLLMTTAVLERLLLLQPLQRLVRRRLVQEIELACDERAIEWTGSGLSLARCLAIVAGWITVAPAPALVASMASAGSGLVQRVERVLAPIDGRTTSARRGTFGVATLALLALLACGGPRIQPALERGPAGEPGSDLASGVGVEPLRARVLDEDRRQAHRGPWLRIEVLEPGRKVEPGGDQPWTGPGRFEFDDTRVLRHSLDAVEAQSLSDLAALLRAAHAEDPTLELAIEPLAGSVYEDVVEILDLAIEAGFRSIVFADQPR